MDRFVSGFQAILRFVLSSRKYTRNKISPFLKWHLACVYFQYLYTYTKNCKQIRNEPSLGDLEIDKERFREEDDFGYRRNIEQDPFNREGGDKWDKYIKKKSRNKEVQLENMDYSLHHFVYLFIKAGIEKSFHLFLVSFSIVLNKLTTLSTF